jgi:hypothetical protein
LQANEICYQTIAHFKISQLHAPVTSLTGTYPVQLQREFRAALLKNEWGNDTTHSMHMVLHEQILTIVLCELNGFSYSQQYDRKMYFSVELCTVNKARLKS